MKRARGGGEQKVDEERIPIVVISSTGDSAWTRRVTAKAAKFHLRKTFPTKKGTRQLFVTSYLQEWDDEELNNAQRCGAEFVNEEFLDRYFPGLQMEQVLAGGAISGIWETRRLQVDEDEEVPVPQSVQEVVQMEDRLQFGADADGDSIVLLNMMMNSRDNRILDQCCAWFRAFFATDRVSVHAKACPPPGRKKQYNYQALLDQIWALKATRPCFAMIGLTDVDIVDEETNDTIYGRATGDGGGVISSFHFKGAKSIRCFLSTAVHESLHVFGLDHCGVFRCLMNSSCDATVESSMSLFLCPCCLPKLNFCLNGQLDIRRRYEKMAQCCEELELHEDAAFARQLAADAAQNEPTL